MADNTYFRTGTGGATAPQLAVTGHTPAAQRKLHVFPEVYFIRPELSPFLHLSRAGAFNRIQVGDPWFRQFEQPEHEYTFQITEAVDIVTTGTAESTVTCDDVSHLKVGDTFMPLDGQGFTGRITAVNGTTNVLTVQWYAPDGTAITGAYSTGSDIAINTYAQLLGHTAIEGSVLPEIVQPVVSSRNNYTETMRHPFGGTRHRLTAEMWVGRGMDHLAKVEWMTAKKAIEWKLKWQTPVEHVSGTTVVRKTGGLFYWITQQNGYANDYGGTQFTKSTFLDDMLNLFEHGGETKILFGSPAFLRIIDGFKDAKIEMSPEQEIYNMKVRWWETTEGRLMLVRDLSLWQPNSYGAGTMRRMCFVVDPQYVDYVTYQGNDIHVELDKQLPEYDGRINEYIGDIGIRVNYSQSHGVLYDIGSFSTA